MQSIIINPKNEAQLVLLKSLFKEMKVTFTISNEKDENKFYPELQKKIENSRKEKKEGTLVRLDSKNIWENI
jgi:hypothetical protein